MSTATQVYEIVLMNLKSIPQRLGASLVIVIGIAVLVARLAGGIDVPGYAATMLVIVFFGALNMVGLGILGSYTWRAFENTNRRPGFVIASQARFPAEERGG